MKILNFGSLNIDYVYTVEHFVRPGETLSSDKRELFCGGKGLNQSVAFARAGSEVYHAGNIGADGQMLADMLESSGVDTRFLKTVSEPTGHAIIQVNKDGENCILLFEGANGSNSQEYITSTLEHFDKGDAVILQNEINLVDVILEKAKQKSLITVLNPSPFNEKIKKINLSLLDWLIINETEGKEISGKTEPDEILNTLLNTYPNLKIVLTLGSKGAIYADKNERVFQDIVPAPVVDTTGAGDTFTGYFFSSVFSKKPASTALKIAATASSIAISVSGAATSIPTLEKVIEKMK